MKAFHANFWAGDLYLDVNKDLLRAVGEGKVRRQSWIFFFRNIRKVFKLFKEAEEDFTPEGSNSRGTHMIMGGMMIVRKGHKGVQYAFSEDFWGESAPSI